MSTTYENAVDTLREVGERLTNELPSSLPSTPTLPDWPDGLVDRVTGRQSNRRNTMLYIGGGVALVLALAWLVRRRRTASDDQQTGAAGTEASRPFSAA